jgi:hypothetical protein
MNAESCIIVSFAEYTYAISFRINRFVGYATKNSHNYASQT